MAGRKTIRQTFDALKREKRIALMPFVPAGYPDLAATAAILPALEEGGASLVEVGFPFSDPIADGPVIQAAFTQALSKKIKVQDVIRTVGSVRGKMTIPIVAMVSYSIVFRYGPERFFGELSTAGFAGVIIPDLPPPEAQAVCTKVRAAGLDTILLVSPSSTPERREEIAGLCSGFVYYLSVAGITGERSALPADLAANVQNLKARTTTPVCVGFGVSKPEHVAQLAPVADGAIVGSAFVRRLGQYVGQSPETLARVSRDYCRELLAGAKA